MKLYCGMDLHANNTVVVVINEEDQVLLDKRLPNDLETILLALAPFRKQLSGCVVESTYNWYWLVDSLQGEGLSVHLANTAAIRQYEGIKYSNDSSDAFHLAHLLRLGILPEGYIYPQAERSVRDLLRRRILLVRQRTTLYLSTQSTIARYTGQRLSSNQVKKMNTQAIHELELPDGARIAVQNNGLVIDSLNLAIANVESTVFKYNKDKEAYQLLTSIPGVGKILGMTIAMETGDIHRFPHVGNYASYARCVKSEKISNGKYKGKGNTKSGNRYLAWAFVEAAHLAAIWEPSVKRFYQRKQNRSHVMVAKKAVANKLARACYHMLMNQTPFDAQRAFG